MLDICMMLCEDINTMSQTKTNEIRQALQVLANEITPETVTLHPFDTPAGERQNHARDAASLLRDEAAGYPLDMREARYLLARVAGNIIPVASDARGNFAL